MGFYVLLFVFFLLVLIFPSVEMYLVILLANIIGIPLAVYGGVKIAETEKLKEETDELRTTLEMRKNDPYWHTNEFYKSFKSWERMSLEEQEQIKKLYDKKEVK